MNKIMEEYEKVYSSHLCNDKNSNYKKYCFSSIPPKQFALISAILGVIISDELGVNEKNALGNFMVNIGQAILTEAAQQQVQESKISENKNDEMQKELDELKRQLLHLKNEY